MIFTMIKNKIAQIFIRTLFTHLQGFYKPSPVLCTFLLTLNGSESVSGGLSRLVFRVFLSVRSLNLRKNETHNRNKKVKDPLVTESLLLGFFVFGLEGDCRVVTR